MIENDLTSEPLPNDPLSTPISFSEADQSLLDEARRSWKDVPLSTPHDTDFIDPDLEIHQIRGTQPGAKYVRVIRAKRQGFERIAPGWLQATDRATEGATSFAHFRRKIRTAVLGHPLATRQLLHERLTKIKALAVLSSDALSSVAYGPEQILAVILIGGAVAWEEKLSLPILAAIMLVLFAIIISYRQTIKAYPHGGGSYIVAKDNLGSIPGLIAASALMTDYVLTVAVSISSGIAQITSFASGIATFTVPLCVAAIVLIALANLRGIKDAGTIFVVPTYLFLISLILAIVLVLYHVIAGNCVNNACIAIAQHGLSYPAGNVNLGTLGALAFGALVLRAFASGSSSLTGIEAISDGVMAFKQPEWKNARTTLTIMGFLLGIMLIGIGIASHALGLQVYDANNAAHYQTLISELAHIASWDLPGHTPGVFYFIVQGSTTLILILAANTAFSDFPRLFFFLSRDEFAPHQFKRLGDRLAYSNGILVLTTLSVVLLVVFRGDVTRLIPLYAIGVFLAFTMSQAGMVKRWWTRREDGWRRSLPINALGMCLTFVVFIVTAASKFMEGAWIIVFIIPTLVFIFWSIHRHYAQATSFMVNELPTSPRATKPVCIVPIAAFNAITLQSLALARSISDHVLAVHVCDEEDHINLLRAEWELWGSHVELEIIESPYRNMIRPLITYIDAIGRQHPKDTIIVLLPELVATRWWHQILHNQTALRLRTLLHFRPGTVVIDVPYHLQSRKATQLSSNLDKPDKEAI